jgi:hypothetical protein
MIIEREQQGGEQQNREVGCVASSFVFATIAKQFLHKSSSETKVLTFDNWEQDYAETQRSGAGGGFMLYDELKHFQKSHDLSCPETGGTDGDGAGGIEYVDKLIVFARHFHLNYYHFVANNLPAIILIREHLIKLDKGDGNGEKSWKVLVHGSKFAIDYLTEVLGIERNRLILYDPCKLYHAQEVAYVEGVVEPTQGLIESIKHAPRIASLLEQEASGDETNGLVLLIDRRDKASGSSSAIKQQRQITNFGKVQDLLLSWLPIIMFAPGERGGGESIRC